MNVDHFLLHQGAHVVASILRLHPQQNQNAVLLEHLSVVQSGTRRRKWNPLQQGIPWSSEPPLDLVTRVHILTQQIYIISFFHELRLLSDRCCHWRIKERKGLAREQLQSQAEPCVHPYLWCKAAGLQIKTSRTPPLFNSTVCLLNNLW